MYPTQDAPSHQRPTFSGRILLVEDDEINQMFVIELLTHYGFVCDVANNGNEALAALKLNRFDLVLMDCQMPEMDGFAASREIRRREAIAELPGRTLIIALSGDAIQDQRCLEAGMDDHLNKPLKSGQLMAIMSKYFESCPVGNVRLDRGSRMGDE